VDFDVTLGRKATKSFSATKALLRRFSKPLEHKEKDT
jgi:hypothetical protein